MSGLMSLPELPQDVDVVRAELERVRTANDGILKAEAVVEAARPKSSPLHDLFEWDDSAAAELYRVAQARRYIQVVMVSRPRLTDEDTPRKIEVEVRGYVSLPSMRKNGGGMVPIHEVEQRHDYREQMLGQALNDVERAANSKQFTGFAELDAFRAEIGRVVARWRYKLEVA